MVGCGGGREPVDGPRLLASVEIVAGNRHGGGVGQPPADPISVRLRSANGAPVAGHVMAVVARAGAGTVFDGVARAAAPASLGSIGTAGPAPRLQTTPDPVVDRVTDIYGSPCPDVDVEWKSVRR